MPFDIIDTVILISLSIIMGGLFGSFTTALVYRLPRGIPVAFGRGAKKGGDESGVARSYCTGCNHQLGAFDLFPVLSFLCLRGKCRYCGAPYGKQYFLIELCSVALSLMIFLFWGLSLKSFVALCAVPVLLALLFIDLEHFILPNILVFLLFVIGVVFRLFIDGAGISVASLLALGFDVVVFGATSFLIGFIFSKILRKDTLGLGDVKFYMAASVWLGGMILPIFMMLSGVLGVLHGGVMRLRHGAVVFPFGPSLIIALVICYLFKDAFYVYFYG
ncbi:MAG: prepilin peptidase [Alphaproteobacteria bacterium]|nr:prepilin peptidase [Alphaproteobacteria bacterium]